MVSSKTKKKQKNTLKNDATHRVNFLYQAAHMALGQFPDNPEISRFYMSTMNHVTLKAMVKMNPLMKRSMCKRCEVTLVPGITSRVRVRGKRETHVVIECLECGCLKRFNARKNFTLWSDRLQDTVKRQHQRSTLQQPGISSQQPQISSQQPGISSQQPGISLQQPGVSSQQPGISSQQPGVSSQQPGVSSQQPGISSQQPGISSQQPAWKSSHQVDNSGQEDNPERNPSLVLKHLSQYSNTLSTPSTTTKPLKDLCILGFNQSVLFTQQEESSETCLRIKAVSRAKKGVLFIVECTSTNIPVCVDGRIVPIGRKNMLQNGGNLKIGHLPFHIEIQNGLSITSSYCVQIK